MNITKYEMNYCAGKGDHMHHLDQRNRFRVRNTIRKYQATFGETNHWSSYGGTSIGQQWEMIFGSIAITMTIAQEPGHHDM